MKREDIIIILVSHKVIGAWKGHFEEGRDRWEGNWVKYGFGTRWKVDDMAINLGNSR